MLAAMQCVLSLLIVSLVGCAGVTAAAIQGFAYGPTNDDGSVKLQAEFQSEFATAKNLVGTSGFTSARLYTTIQAGSASDPTQAIPAAIAEDTTLLLGMWASGGQTNFNNEIAALKSAISHYGSSFTNLVVGISVGSEDLYRISPTGIAAKAGDGASPDVIVSYISQVRTAIEGTELSGVSIGHVDQWTAWVNSSNSAVLSAVDWVGADIYPYFQSTQANSINNDKALFQDAYAATSAAAGGKSVWITETGWPTSGSSSNLAVASTSNAKQYWDDIGCSLFGKTNTWWYTLLSSTMDPNFGVATNSSITPLFDLSCVGLPAKSTSTSSQSSARPTTSGSSTTLGSSFFTSTGTQSSSSIGEVRSGSTGTGTQSSSSTGETGSTSSTGTGTQPSSSTGEAGNSEKQNSSNLSGGAIAGIVIGILIIFAALSILAFFCLRRRRAAIHGSQESSRGAELPTKTNTHEILGSAIAVPNDDKHELHTQSNSHEMSENGAFVAGTALPQESRETPEMQTQSNVHELPGSRKHLAEASSATYSPTSESHEYGAISPDQFELASEPMLPELAAETRKPQQRQDPVLPPPLSGKKKSDAMVQGYAMGQESTSASSGHSKLDILQQRIERVRAEKERLAKERELEEMEAALQQEIMAELRKEHGIGDGT